MKAGASLAKVPELGPKLLNSSSHELAGYILTFLHGLGYLPLVLLPAMQDAHLKLVAVLNTLLCLCLVVGNWLFNYLGIVKVRVSKAHNNSNSPTAKQRCVQTGCMHTKLNGGCPARCRAQTSRTAGRGLPATSAGHIMASAVATRCWCLCRERPGA